jgi:uncharacterized protein (TIGR03067 family)
MLIVREIAMRSRLLVVAIGTILGGVGLLGAADDAKQKAIKEDFVKMTGTWKVIYAENDGKKVPKKDLKTMRLIQKGPKWTFEGGDEDVAGVDKIDPTQKPKTSDSTLTKGADKGKTILGIYELDGDTFKACWADPGRERPKEFATKPNSGQHYLILKRVKTK